MALPATWTLIAWILLPVVAGLLVWAICMTYQCRRHKQRTQRLQGLLKDLERTPRDTTHTEAGVLGPGVYSYRTIVWSQRTSPGAIVLSTNVRDELNLAEWVAYHHSLGFDHIVIIDHRSSPPIRAPAVDYVTVIRDVDSSKKPEILERVIELTQALQASWAIHLDADEYLSFPVAPHQSVQHYLEHQPPDTDVVAINWLMLGTSGHTVNPYPGFLMPSYRKSQPQCDRHVKCFFRPDRIDYFAGLHHPEAHAPTQLVYRNSRAEVWDKPSPFHKNIADHWSQEHAVIFHYSVQDATTYAIRKYLRARDDGSTMGDRIPLPQDLSARYNDEDNMFMAHAESKVRDVMRRDDLISSLVPDQLAVNYSMYRLDAQ